MKAPSPRTLQYIALYSDDAARLGYNHIQTRKKKAKAKKKRASKLKETSMITKSANAQASPGQAIYDLLRVYRGGARYGVMLSPVVNGKKVDNTVEQISTLKNKLDAANSVKPEAPVQPGEPTKDPDSKIK